MSYDLFIGDKAFSSWSLRGWLMLRRFGLPFREHRVGLYSGTMARDLAALAPARLVPVLRTPGGEVIGDSLAIAETLAERHPEAGLWPDDPAPRARARWLAAEMHTGFAALRAECPMQLLHLYDGFAASAAVRDDLARLEEIWAAAWAMGGTPGGWLLGRYSIADVFFAPVAARIAGFGLTVGPDAARYVAAHVTDPAFVEWHTAARQLSYDPEPYAMDLPARPWLPGQTR